MASTVLKRKKLKNRLRSQERQTKIKQLTQRPPIKKVDIEEMKANFPKQESKPAKNQGTEKE